uniref:Uncharacterized protein n=1 Tax=Arundo donax TaxID=35708 RepID=A0A0A9GSM4_ARUDO
MPFYQEPTSTKRPYIPYFHVRNELVLPSTTIFLSLLQIMAVRFLHWQQRQLDGGQKCQNILGKESNWH